MAKASPNPTTDLLADLRARIDAIDERLVELISERARLAVTVADVKRDNGEHGYYRPEREAQVLRRIAELNPGPLATADMLRLFREIMSACLALERPLEVAFLGPEGTFTHIATLKHFGNAVRLQGVAGDVEVFRCVSAGTCDYGVVPIENSIEGVVTHTLDALAGSDLSICGEIEIPVQHNLLSNAPSLDGVREVFAHPQAFAQCRTWLDANLPGAAQVPVSSNAEGAARARASSQAGAIASLAAAAIYELGCLAEHIETMPDNTTRFVVVGRTSPGPSGNDKTSIVFIVPNRPGALHRVLSVFERHGINMTRIESRPLRRVKWDYSFFVDVQGHFADAAVAAALQEVSAQVVEYRLLGSYPRAAL